ncbi:(R)-1-hydroxy-2-aminoethylphosphonate ammonia-lyase [Paracidobacterium acidisoli]|uniref:Aspartate aminotransferase family protein n=1 Tax=Paracidobacterium acidisoli TaxID=2303751 RepID=A0A372ILH8_9BACT|nr:aspartate aminotransferase family protein [Paracidobacterium acidisoli]MBT9332339.1 aspartate aminotransferase family protein [Paracidobacterium acidisoli]
MKKTGDEASVPQSEGDVNSSVAREAWQREHLDEETQELLAEDARYFLHQSLSSPCLNALSACEGSFLIDVQGRRYLDFHGNNVHQVGFGHPRVKEAIQEALNHLPFCTRRYTNRYAVALAKKLAGIAPGKLNKCLFAPGGAEAISMAVGLARMATGRFKTISMWDSFHGATLDAISLGGEALFRNAIGPLLPGAEHVPPPEPLECPFRCGTQCNLQCADYVEYILRKEGDVAAVIAETVRSTGTIPPRDYWVKLRSACDRYGAFLILDEIPHALGRTGSMFTCEQYDIVPDMLVIGKGLGGGCMPVAALLAREDLDIGQDRALGHFTHEKNPVACAAALATLEVIEEEGLVERARILGARFLDQLRQLQQKHSLIYEVRGIGLLIALVLRTPDGSPANAEAEQMMYAALTRGLSFKVTMGCILVLTPPLTIEKQHLDDAVQILDDCLSELEKN